MYAFIHGCSLQCTGIITSGFVNLRMTDGEPGCCVTFQSRLASPTTCMLCVVGSSVCTCRGCPTMIPSTCGSYIQPRCVKSTELRGAVTDKLPDPDLMYTNAFGSVPSALTSPSCAYTLSECSETQTGSFRMSSGDNFGF